MASSCLVKKILADFLSRFHLLNYVLKHATDPTRKRSTVSITSLIAQSILLKPQ